MCVGAVSTSKHEDVVVVDLLLLIGEFEKLLIYLVEFLSAHLHSVHTEAVFQRGTSGACCQNDGVVVNANFLRVHNLVC